MYLICTDEEYAKCSMSISRNLPSNMIFHPVLASTEFSTLLVRIIKELEKNETENLELIKVICSHLTVNGEPNVLLFNEEQQGEINSCSNIRTLFTTKLRPCWRWDDFDVLKIIVSSVDSDGHCEQLIDQYETKLLIQMKLQDIHEYCQQQQQDLPEGFHKMVAIVQNKCFYRITLEEYKKLKEFIYQHCKIVPYVLSPFMSVEVRIVIVVS